LRSARNRRMWKLAASTWLSCGWAASRENWQPTPGPLSLALSYGDHMVLQQAPQRANVWGFTGHDEPFNLTIEGGGQRHDVSVVFERYNATVFSWLALLPPIAAEKGEDGKAVPYTLSAQQMGQELQILDVLFGDVWICSGQSNMAFLLEMAFNGSDLVQDANNHPELRFMTTRKTTADVPLRELIGPVREPWSVSSNLSVSQNSKLSATSGDDNWLYMSAVCYLYGLNIHKARGIPVGLINTNWGGTAIQDWMSTDALAACTGDGNDAEVSTPALATGVGHATHLFNAMVSPLMNHTISGAVWYQGESNSGSPVAYGCQQPALVADWRTKWHAASGGHTAADFPFGVVQLAPVLGYDYSAIRWFQTGSPSEGVAFGHLPNPVMPNTFMAVAYDLGDAESPYGSVHIRYKTEVGERLALAGRRVAYGEDVCSGPVFNRLRVVDGSIDVEFNATSCGGLVLSAMNLTKAEDQGNWTGESPFEVCMPAVMDPIPASCGVLGKHDDWYPVPAATVRADGRTVTLSGLPGPVAAVRFAWRSYPCEHLACGLYTEPEHLPPPPFWAEVPPRASSGVEVSLSV